MSVPVTLGRATGTEPRKQTDRLTPDFTGPHDGLLTKD